MKNLRWDDDVSLYDIYQSELEEELYKRERHAGGLLEDLMKAINEKKTELVYDSLDELCHIFNVKNMYEI